MKGIILAGGSGTRLYPITKSISKQLVPVYDKPMIYYPLTTLIYSGINEIAIISTPKDLPAFEALLGNGQKYGCKFTYLVQEVPNGLAQAFVIAEDFIGQDKVCLILGDNIFQMKINNLRDCQNVEGSIVFGYHVNDPQRYGVVEFDNDKNVISIEEKPKNPKSNYAVPGLYFYDNSVLEVAKNLKPSKRGEYEITDVNNYYLSIGELEVHKFGRGHAWLDTGTHDSLLEASQFVATLEHRQGLKIACIEEISHNCGFIDNKELAELASKASNNSYGNYLRSLVNQ